MSSNKRKSSDSDGDEDIPSSPRSRVSATQIELLTSFMERCPDLALSRSKGREAIYVRHKKWGRIAAALNKVARGKHVAKKTAKGWLKYWADLKFRVRRKYEYIRDGGSHMLLTPFEKRLVAILTDKEGGLINWGPHELNNGESAKSKSSRNSAKIHEENADVHIENADGCRKNAEGGDLNFSGDVLDNNVNDSSNDCFGVSDNEPILVKNRTSDSYITNIGTVAVTGDPIDITKKPVDDIEIEVHRFNLKKQKEMHDLEMEQMKERHKLEIDILRLRKRRLQQELERTKKMYIRVEEVNRDGT